MTTPRRSSRLALTCALAGALAAGPAACSDRGTVCELPVSSASPPPPPPASAELPPRPPTPGELALVAPAAPGGKLEDFDVREARVHRGVLELVCEKGAARVVLSVAVQQSGGPTPPASTERYAVFYSLRGAEPEDGERLAKALVTLLKPHDGEPVPPDLGPFVPRPVSL